MDVTIELRPRSSSSSRGIGTVLLVLAIFLVFPSSAVAQTNTDAKMSQNEIFSPSMAVIVVVLVASVFFMVFFLVYIRQCSSLQAEGGSIRNLPGRSRRAARGLDASVIATFPTFFYSEVKALKKGREALECAVCLNEFEEDEMLRLIPRCDHVFHPECIDAWLESHTTCPVCRANLAPKTEDSEVPPTESTEETDVENQVVAVEEQQPVSPPHATEDDSPALKMLNGNRTRSSPRSGRLRWFYPRSHSTGHSLVQPGENTERFTLKLPVEVRNLIMNRQLHRATSLVVLPREISSRRGYRFGGGEGSGRGKSSRRLYRTEMSKSDRWVFSVTPPFFTRMSSMKTAKVLTDSGEGTSAGESKMELRRDDGQIRCFEDEAEGCKRRIKLLLQKVDGVYTVFIDAQGGRVKVTGNFDTHNLTKKLEKSAKCSEMIEAEKSSHSSVKSAPQSERSQSGNSKAGGSHKSQNSVKSGGEAQSHKGSKAPTSASMENKSVKMINLTDLESKGSGKSRVSENGGGKNGGLFGFGKFLGFGKNGGKKGPKLCSEKSHSERGGETVHGGSIKKVSSRKDDFHGSEVAHSAAGSSRGGSKKSSKKRQMSLHSEEKAGQVDDIPLIQDPVGRSSNGGSKKGSKTGPTSHHSGEKASQVDREHSVGRSSGGGSKKGSKSGPMSHHSGAKRSQMGDPYNQQDLPMATMMNQQRGAYYDAPHRPPPPPPQRESYEHYFSDENANGCIVM